MKLQRRTWFCLAGLLVGANMLYPSENLAAADVNAPVRLALSKEFKKLDTDHNGSLSLREFRAAGMITQSFHDADSNHDKRLSPDEFIKATAIEQRIRSGQFFDDAWVTARVKALLLENSVLRGLRIQVETKNGVVLLSGKVSSTDQVRHVLALASSVEGVKSIHNDLLLK